MNLRNEFGEKKWENFGGVSPLIAVFKSFHQLSPDIEQIINEQTALPSIRMPLYEILDYYCQKYPNVDPNTAKSSLMYT